MYISTTAPEFPTLKATLNIKPIEPEPMKVTNRYKNDWAWLPYAMFAWVVFLVITHFYA